ncbi:hypothetical protein E5345_05385 [Propionibacterium sp. NM47_B9-13]|nr:hypothetical protein E5345_05385 [Propionibacterium sp. NM47_B9-13]
MHVLEFPWEIGLSGNVGQFLGDGSARCPEGLTLPREDVDSPVSACLSTQPAVDGHFPYLAQEVNLIRWQDS